MGRLLGELTLAAGLPLCPELATLIPAATAALVPPAAERYPPEVASHLCSQILVHLADVERYWTQLEATSEQDELEHTAAAELYCSCALRIWPDNGGLGWVNESRSASSDCHLMPGHAWHKLAFLCRGSARLEAIYYLTQRYGLIGVDEF